MKVAVGYTDENRSVGRFFRAVISLILDLPY